MNQPLMEKILRCPSLPSLPANAMEVVELCRHDNVQLQRLAMTIGRDPALTTKLLRTVNSAHFGLRNKVTTISHAVALLGIKMVKSLALGFTLVGSLHDGSGEEFDAAPIWQRSLISASGARSIALKCGKGHPEEAYLAGLLQDVGILALIQALGTPYINLLQKAGDCYGELWQLEQQVLDLDHTMVGEALAKEWNLPPILTTPIRFHEQPEAAAGVQGQDTSLAVALGNKIAIPFMTNPESTDSLEDFFSSATLWFGLDHKNAAQILEMAGRIGSQMSELCDLDCLGEEDIEKIITIAHGLKSDTDDGDELRQAG
jgi:HD-like signal output (HDOD) protein